MAIKQELTTEEKLILIRVLNQRIYCHMTENSPIHKKSFLKKYVLSPIAIIEKIATGNNKLTRWEQSQLNGCIRDAIDFRESEEDKQLLKECSKKMDFNPYKLLAVKKM